MWILLKLIMDAAPCDKIEVKSVRVHLDTNLRGTMPPMIVTASHARRRRYNRKARGKRLAAAGHAELSPEDRASVSEAEENLLPVCVNKKLWKIYCSYTSNHLPSCSCPSCPSCSKKRGTDGTLVVHTWQFQNTFTCLGFYIKNIHFFS